MSNVVISTRVRLARNLKNYPFPCKLSQQGREEVIEKVRDAVKNGNSVLANDFSYIKMSELDPRQSVSLVERRLVSPEFVSDAAGRALLLSSDESLSIMLNEEDHIRLQVITPGLSLEQAYDTADKLDTLLDERLEFAFDEKLGYLTQCPTNLGTGMRASVMLHLPALEKSSAISRIAGNLSKLGLTMRGAHGEGTEPQGALYQLSNQVTLGISEKAAIENLKNITIQLAAQEEQARERLCKSLDVQDTIARIDPLPGAKEFLDELRTITQVIVLSDTFSQFAQPLMKKLGWPTLFCNELIIDDEGYIADIRMRCDHSKLTTVRGLQSIGYDTIAAGDSYNDLEMIQASKAGFLFRSTEQIKKDYPQFPAFEEYDEFLAAIKAAL